MRCRRCSCEEPSRWWGVLMLVSLVVIFVSGLGFGARWEAQRAALAVCGVAL